MYLSTICFTVVEVFIASGSFITKARIKAAGAQKSININDIAADLLLSNDRVWALVAVIHSCYTEL